MKSFFFSETLKKTWLSFVAALFSAVGLVAEVRFAFDEEEEIYRIEGSFEEILSSGLPVPVFTVKVVKGSPRLGKRDYVKGVVGTCDPWDHLTFKQSKEDLLSIWPGAAESMELVLFWIRPDQKEFTGEALGYWREEGGYNERDLGYDYEHQIPVILALDNQSRKLVPARGLQNEIGCILEIYRDDVNALRQRDININDRYLGYSLLHWSASYGAEECVRYLSANGFDPDAKALNNVLPIHLASIVGNSASVKVLIDHKSSKNPLEKQNKRTPLYYASKYGHLEVVRALLEAGAKTRFSSKETAVNPLYAALNNFHHEIVNTLLGSGLKFNSRDSNKDVFLLRVVSNDALEIAEFLLEKKINLRKPIRGTSPILIAAAEGSQEMIELLLQHGADIDFQDSKGRTALMMSVIFDQKDVFNFLLKRGANLDLTTMNGRSALANAIFLKRNEMAYELIDRGANLEVKEKGLPLVYQATYANNREALNRLISAGAPCVINPEMSMSLMDYAFRYDIPEVVDFALNQCLDSGFKFYDYFPPDWVADYYGSKAISALLRERGVTKPPEFNPNLVTNKEVKSQIRPLEISNPPYPIDLQDLFGEFMAKVQIVIDLDGQVVFPKVLENPVPQMERMILENVSKWKFEPITLNSKPVRTTFRVPLRFVPTPEEERIHERDTVDVMPIMKKAVIPRFPMQFVARGVKGRVDLIIVIDEQGKVTVEGVKGYTHPEAANACVEAVRQWEFTPGYIKGQPVKARFVQPIPYDYSG